MNATSVIIYGNSSQVLQTVSNPRKNRAQSVQKLDVFPNHGKTVHLPWK